MAAPVLSLESQLLQAVFEVRAARHHPVCDRSVYRRNGAGYCTAAEATWSASVDRILTTIMQRAK